jgi:hypothetical protein
MATVSASVPSVPARAEPRGALASLVLPLATAISLLGIALLVMLTPWSVHIALDSGGSAAALGTSADVTHRLSDETVRDLVLGGDFAVVADGGALYTPAEVGHLGNARLVLYAFLVVAAACAAIVLSALVRRADRASAWRAIGRGGAGLAVVVLALGIIGLVAFGPAFELFHRIFFFGGNWAFDPGTSTLVRLYPQAFWVAASAMLGGFALGLGLLTWAATRIRTWTPR